MSLNEEQAIIRECRDCAQPFEISVEEQAWLQRLAAEKPSGDGKGWHWPSRCTACRAARRAVKYNTPVDPDVGDEWLTCVDCGVDFEFGGRDREFFAARRFAKPKRCRPCRTARKSARHA